MPAPDVAAGAVPGYISKGDQPADPTAVASGVHDAMRLPASLRAAEARLQARKRRESRERIELSETLLRGVVPMLPEGALRSALDRIAEDSGVLSLPAIENDLAFWRCAGSHPSITSDDLRTRKHRQLLRVLEGRWRSAVGDTEHPLAQLITFREERAQEAREAEAHTAHGRSRQAVRLNGCSTQRQRPRSRRTRTARRTGACRTSSGDDGGPGGGLGDSPRGGRP